MLIQSKKVELKDREVELRSATVQDAFHVTAFLNEHVIGDLGVTPVGNYFKERHRAYLGISIQQAYCNQGLGIQTKGWHISG